MNPNELRELADTLTDESLGHHSLMDRAAAYLREQADRMEQGAVAWSATFDAWWVENHIATHKIKGSEGFARKVWRAAVHSVAGVTDNAAGFYPADGGSIPPRQATHPAPQSAPEVDVLRAMQSAAVMPLIGPLLDAWDGMPNDFKGEMREEVPDLTDALRKIGRAMDGQAIAASPAAPEGTVSDPDTVELLDIAEFFERRSNTANATFLRTWARHYVELRTAAWGFFSWANRTWPHPGGNEDHPWNRLGTLLGNSPGIPDSAAPAAPAPADVVEALRELVAYVDEPAGFNAALATDTDSFVAFMDAIEQKRKAIVERARAALAAVDKERG